MAADADLTAQRMAAWRRACAAGDASLFARRLTRDGLSPVEIENRLACSQRRASAPYPRWIEDSIWIEQAFKEAGQTEPNDPPVYPFQHLFTALIGRAEALVWSGVDACACSYFDERARASLRHTLFAALSELCAPALYERFAKSRDPAKSRDFDNLEKGTGKHKYCNFTVDQRSGASRHLSKKRPVVLRLSGVLTRQWIDATREFIDRLAADLPAVRRELINATASAKIIDIK